MIRVTLRSLLAHKWRLVTTSIAIVLAIAFLSGTQILGGILDDSIKGLIGDVYSGYDSVVRSPDVQKATFGEFRAPVSADAVVASSGVDGARLAYGVVESSNIQLIGSDGKVTGGGIGPPTLVMNWIDDPMRPGTLADGRGPTADDEVAIDFKAAEEQGWELGEGIEIATQEGSEQFTVVGFVGLGSDADKTAGAQPVFFTEEVARSTAKLGDEFNYVAVSAEDGVSQDELASQLAEANPDLQVITGEAFTVENQDAVAQFVGILTSVVSIFGFIALVVSTFIIYNTFSIIVAQRTRETALLRAIGARRRQVIVSTLVEALVVGLFASVVGLLLGALLASALVGLLSSFFSLETGVPSIGASVIVTSLFVGLVVTTLSAVIPAVRSSRIPPIAALSEVSLDKSGMSWSRRVWGVAFLLGGIALTALGLTSTLKPELYYVGAGLLAILISVAVVLGPLLARPAAMTIGWPFGNRRGSVTAVLASENAARNPRRTAATAAALTVGVTLVSVIAVLATSVKSSVDDEIQGAFGGVDLIVSAGNFSFLGVPPEISDSADEIDGIDIVSPVGFTFMRILEESLPSDPSEGDTGAQEPDDDAVPVIGIPDDAPSGEDVVSNAIDPDTYFRMIDMGDLQGDPETLGSESLIARQSVAEENGWEIGDTVPVYFAATGTQNLTLGLTYTDALGPGDDFYLPLETMRPNSLPGFDIDFADYVKLDDDADRDAVVAELDALVADRPDVTVQDREEFIASQTAFIDVFVNIVYALLALAVIIALIGIANTLSLSVMERTREFGLLRAVGMSRRQLRRTIRLEAVIVAVFGTVLGIVIGIAFAAALSSALAAGEPGLVTFKLPWIQLAVIVIMAAFAGVVAAIIPARRAANMDVLAAIDSD